MTPLEFVIKISRQNCIPEPSSNEEIDILQAGSDQGETRERWAVLVVSTALLLSVTGVTPLHLHIHLPHHMSLRRIDISEASSDPR